MASGATNFSVAATRNLVVQRCLQPVLQRCSRSVRGMNLLIAIRTEFQMTANSHEARRALAGIAAAHPPLARYESLAEVLSALHTGDLPTQVELLNSLISHARTEPLARLTIVEAFARLIGRYRVVGPVDLDDYRSELVAALLTEIDRLAGLPAHPYPATMLARAVDRAARKWRRLASQAPEPLEAISDDIDGEILIAELDGDPLQPPDSADSSRRSPPLSVRASSALKTEASSPAESSTANQRSSRPGAATCPNDARTAI